MTHATGPDLTSFDNDPEVEKLNQDLHAAGEVVEEKRIVNYFGAPERFQFFLPDGVQYFEYSPLTEGGKAKYEKATNKDIRVQRTTGDAKMSVDPATERQTLVRLSTVDAKIYAPDRTGALAPVKFDVDSPTEFWDKVFKAFPPKLIQDYYRDIRDQNPWMRADEDVEAMKKERDNLDQRIEAAEEAEAKKTSS